MAEWDEQLNALLGYMNYWVGGCSHVCVQPFAAELQRGNPFSSTSCDSLCRV